jgi:hypothetical protein
MSAGIPDRLKMLEHRVGQMQLELSGQPVRQANPLNLRQGWWVGELADDLEENATAPVTVMRWNGSSWESTGQTVTGRSFFPGAMTQGTKVYVRWYYNTFVVISTESEKDDRIVLTFILTEDMDATTVFQASATVIESAGTGAPAASASITVHDPEALFGDCPSGAEGVAINFGTVASPRYIIVECKRVSKLIRLTATSNIKASERGDVSSKLEFGEYFGIGEFSEDPGSDWLVTNPCGFTIDGGQPGDTVWAERVSNQKSGGKWQYEIHRVEVQKRTKLGVLYGELIQGGAAIAREITHDGLAFVIGDIFTVTDFFMNVGETVPIDTKLIAHRIDGVWVPITYCRPSDTIPSQQPQQLMAAEDQNALALSLVGSEPQPTFDPSLTG